MLKEINKSNAIKILGLVLIFSLIIPPIIRAWNWAEGKVLEKAPIAFQLTRSFYR
jgi:ABC-type Mn2+/Zn2+ transport system permease subunit